MIESRRRVGRAVSITGAKNCSESEQRDKTVSLIRQVNPTK